MIKEIFDDSEREVISNAYELEILDEKIPERGNKNKVAILNTTKGKVVIKNYSADFTQEILEFQLKLNEFVYNTGLPTPKIIKNIDGKQLTIHNNKFYSLMTFLEGAHPDENNLEDLGITFEGLARFNKLLSEYNNPTECISLPRFSNNLSQQFFELSSYLPLKPKNNIDQYVIDTMESIKLSINNLEQKLPLVKTSPQLIHGDFNLGCTLINNKELSGILDYDFIRMDLKAVDAMHTLDLYCFDNESKDKPLIDRVNWTKLEKCFSVYKNYDPSIKDQIQHMPSMLAKIGLNSLMVTWSFGYRPESTIKQKEYFTKKYDFFVNRVNIAIELEKELINALERA